MRPVGSCAAASWNASHHWAFAPAVANGIGARLDDGRAADAVSRSFGAALANFGGRSMRAWGAKRRCLMEHRAFVHSRRRSRARSAGAKARARHADMTARHCGAVLADAEGRSIRAPG
ncbi:MAG TPA: hypothetical protein VKB88_37720 [Bryobacteraceae bacterium]|nr:hypothetical protein [Bryobacteraceae bacterium]